MSRPGPSKPAVARRPITGPARRTLNTSGIARSSTSANGKPDDGYLYVAGVRDQSKRVAEYRTDSDTCPICHTDRQFNKNLRLLISPCYHKMCESCIDRLFTLGPEPCPQCGKILRKINFAHQTFEDLKVEKEVAVRRRMAECYNKRADDFASSKEYDDFLEQAEDITFNLLNDIDLEKTEARIAEFMQKNAKSIAANKQKAQRELLSLNEREEEIKRDKDLWRKQIEQSEIFEEREEQRVKREIVEAMARQAHATVEDIKTRAAEAKLIRERNLIASIPPSLVDLLPNRLKLHHVNTAHHQTVKLDTDDPLSVHYNGPFVPFAYSDPSKAEWSEWYDLLEDYVDGRKGVMDVKKDKEGRFRGGGFDLKLFWEMEVRSAVESLGVEPL